MKPAFNKNRHRQESKPRVDIEARALTATVAHSTRTLRHAPLTGARPLHNDERLALFRVRYAINEFFKAQTHEETRNEQDT